MLRVMRFRSLFLCAALLGLWPSTGSAQSLDPSGRATVALPQALGMGDALVALPQQQSAFFYNPAHAAKSKRHVTFFGLRTGFSTNLLDQVDFFRNELQPALDDGLDTLPTEELDALYTRTLEVSRQSALLGLDVLAPSAGLRIGRVGVALGAFANSGVRYRFYDNGLPNLLASASAGIMGVGSVGMEVTDGLSAGITAKYTHRLVMLQNAPIDLLAEDLAFFAYAHNRMSVDLGFLYRVPIVSKLPGTLNVGLALYDIGAKAPDFQYERTLTGDETARPTEQDIANVNALYGVTPSFRFGVAYSLPKLPGGLIDQSGFTIDYLGFSEPQFDQVFLTHLRVGAQATVKFFSLRAGISQGYPSIGGGLSFGFIDVDYSYYGMEEGRYPGQLPVWSHSAQLRFGL